ncbi:hypothetical protein EVAR_9665_1 [Eumeta japonica]|uniref:Uncharacterized protein n=1 Tax=Eumeta variegata TaxID=151549 RepID=A0A4C1TJP2_EUMVA|nr:hypothetical protein EVAR_9665_1 [Eumeta japonica]
MPLKFANTRWRTKKHGYQETRLSLCRPSKSPYRLLGNGAVKNIVKPVKKCIEKTVVEREDTKQTLDEMLFHYRNYEYWRLSRDELKRKLQSVHLDALLPDT